MNGDTERLGRSLNNAVAKASIAEIIAHLESMWSKKNRAGMKRYGINIEKIFGVSVSALRQLAREMGNTKCAVDCHGRTQGTQRREGKEKS